MANKYFEAKLNSKEVTDTLKRYAKEVGDLNPALRISRRMLLNAIDQNFETEGTSSGEKFKEWSDGYKAWRKKKGKTDSKILHFDGNLRKSMSSKITREELIIGTPKEYAAAHNFGYAPRNLPQREFMRISEEVKNELLGEIAYDLAVRIASRTKG